MVVHIVLQLLGVGRQAATGLRRLTSDDRGNAFVEYAFLLTLIVVVCMMAVTALGTANHDSVLNSAESITNAGH